MSEKATYEELENRVKALEKKISIHQTEYHQIFDDACDGMRVIDKNHTITRVNSAYAILAGMNKDKLIGRKCHQTFTCHNRDTPNCCVTRILSGEEQAASDVVRERPDGGKLYCLVVSAALKDPDGQLIGIVQNFKESNLGMIRLKIKKHTPEIHEAAAI